jgi:hypothetical protein
MTLSDVHYIVLQIVAEAQRAAYFLPTKSQIVSQAPEICRWQFGAAAGAFSRSASRQVKIDQPARPIKQQDLKGKCSDCLQ